VDQCDYDPDAGLVNRRRFTAVWPDEWGRPDGVAVDVDGGVWVAGFGGAAVRRFATSGQLDDVVTVPTPNVTSCTFGGDGLRTMFITTSAVGLAPGSDPLAGAVFASKEAGQGIELYRCRL
jgi:sugar lactone lactonase YvrE